MIPIEKEILFTIQASDALPEQSMEKLAQAQADFSDQKVPALGQAARNVTGGLNTSIRGLSMAANSLTMIGLLSDDTRGIWGQIRASVMLGYAGLMVYNSVKSVVQAMSSLKLAQAIGESALPVNWVKIPLGLGAAFAGGSALGYIVSESGNQWINRLPKAKNLKMFDMKNPYERRQGLRQIGA